MKQHYQVLWQLQAVHAVAREQLEQDLQRFVSTLAEQAPGLALGPVGGVHFTTNTVELEFTVVASDPHELNDKLGLIGRALRAGDEYRQKFDCTLRAASTTTAGS